jgi:hypothetical protein
MYKSHTINKLKEIQWQIATIPCIHVTMCIHQFGAMHPVVNGCWEQAISALYVM